MTPFRKTNAQGGLFAANDDNEEVAAARTRLFDAPADDDEEMDSMSPPRVSKLQPSTNLPTSDLFGNTEANNSRGSGNSRRRRMRTRQSSGSPDSSFVSDVSSADSSILRNMDMNTTSPSSRRKRPSDLHPAGPEELMEESDDEDDMFVSPRASPTYRTMDGRTVTSKNPFSPYTPTHDEDLMNPDMQMAPTFPLYLYGSRDSKKSATSAGNERHQVMPGIRPKVNLLRQNAPRAAQAGYPDQHGRYSFSGSPIEEIDIIDEDNGTSMGSKIRRLALSDNASTTAHSLFVNTANVNDRTTIDDRISPNDVASFPTPPSAPKKAARPRYTPLKTAPPQTPMPARRNIARMREEEHDEEMANAVAPKSRFHQDFDVIGELGTGSFGTVYKCLSRLDGCLYAVKAAKRKAKGNADRDRMLKEVR
jgi:hypothetical protein